MEAICIPESPEVVDSSQVVRERQKSSPAIKRFVSYKFFRGNTDARLLSKGQRFRYCAFANAVVFLCGNEFHDCTFDGCRLVDDGSGSWERKRSLIQDCELVSPINWATVEYING